MTPNKPAQRNGRKLRDSGDKSKRPQRRRGGAASRTHANRVLATGVGNVPTKAWGSSRGGSLLCWDAKHPHHLSLPRAVGPYTTIRATRRVATGRIANIIGTFKSRHNSSSLGEASADTKWSEIIMISDHVSANPINGTDNTFFNNIDLGELGSAATLVPSALTVQIVCPDNLAADGAKGVVYAGVMNTQAMVGGKSDSWDAYMNRFVQFQSPRMLAATKLALRGVTINSYPLDMSEVSDFTQLHEREGLEYTGTMSSLSPQPAGWAPICIYNPQGALLELLITVEYRVRFDLEHPASASHVHHPVASDSTWDKLTRKASSLGHGVMDIADVVANIGSAVRTGRQMLSAFG
ncbi:hypothetical protein [Beihai weivirus-like virus 4]|uniref:hypothetical protein n=1 Tax=Beihai weivirus-like virus 4 TaxID=1922752 RepID=UPI00090B542E|nr:hypothetical protein [Beihai weivirus-like virus 4]APG78119.1 hypothetical protein [Beihai weivirus-like virus 4]